MRHHAIGVNFLDIYYRTGLYPRAAAVHARQRRRGRGDRGRRRRRGIQARRPRRLCHDARLLCARSATSTPSISSSCRRSVCYEQAAAMMLKGLTAQYLLRQTYRVQPGRHDPRPCRGRRRRADPLPMGQASRRDGDRHASARRRRPRSPRACGAEHVILYREEDFAERVGEITKGAKCAVVYDGVGKATFPASLDCLRPFGVFASFGSASGPVEAFNLGLLGAEGLAVRHPADAVHLPGRPRAAGDDGARPVRGRRLAATVKVEISERAPLAEAAAACIAISRARDTTGSIVLICPDRAELGAAGRHALYRGGRPRRAR